jgi:hypothetical protein
MHNCQRIIIIYFQGVQIIHNSSNFMPCSVYTKARLHFLPLIHHTVRLVLGLPSKLGLHVIWFVNICGLAKYHVNAILGLYHALTFLGCAVFMFLFIVILPFWICYNQIMSNLASHCFDLHTLVWFLSCMWGTFCTNFEDGGLRCKGISCSWSESSKYVWNVVYAMSFMGLIMKLVL